MAQAALGLMCLRRFSRGAWTRIKGLAPLGREWKTESEKQGTNGDTSKEQSTHDGQGVLF
jgi:hypothetical protein